MACGFWATVANIPILVTAVIVAATGIATAAQAQGTCLSAQRNILTGKLVRETHRHPAQGKFRTFVLRLSRPTCIQFSTSAGRRGINTGVTRLQMAGDFDRARAAKLNGRQVTVGARGFLQSHTAWHVTGTLVDALWVRGTTPRYRGSDALVEMRDEAFGAMVAVPYRLFRKTAPAPRKAETKLTSRDGAVSLYFFARDKRPKAGIAGYYRRALVGYRGARLTYRRLGRNFFVLSGRWPNGRSFYQTGATYIVKGDRDRAGQPAYAGFVVRWPVARDADVTPHIPKMFQSFWDSVR